MHQFNTECHLQYNGDLKSIRLNFKWTKKGWFANGPDLERDLKFGSQTTI